MPLTREAALALQVIEDKIVPNDTGCWIFIGNRDSGSYGRVRWNGPMTYVHRIYWEAHKGPIPEKMMVLHKCDNPSCCNPEHLFLGNNTDNMLDMHAKGRGNDFRGENHPLASLRTGQVVEIIQLLKEGLSYSKIGKQYNISITAVYKINNGLTWKNIPRD